MFWSAVVRWRSTTILTEIPAPMMATSNGDCVATAVLRIAFIAALFCCDNGILRYLEVSVPLS